MNLVVLEQIFATLARSTLDQIWTLTLNLWSNHCFQVVISSFAYTRLDQEKDNELLLYECTSWPQYYTVYTGELEKHQDEYKDYIHTY